MRWRMQVYESLHSSRYKATVVAIYLRWGRKSPPRRPPYSSLALGLAEELRIKEAAIEN